MDNQEEILDALEHFEKKKGVDVPPVLERYLCRIAKTGETLFPWCRVKPLLMNKLEDVMTKFYQDQPTDQFSPCPNVESVKFQEMRKRILDSVNGFPGAPFTIQRLCELVTEPKKHYKCSDKFMRGIEKNVLVISTVDPFGKKIVSDNRNAMVNGLDDTPVNGNQSESPTTTTPQYSSFPTQQQTNWPTDSWAGVSANKEHIELQISSEVDPQSTTEMVTDNITGDDQPLLSDSENCADSTKLGIEKDIHTEDAEQPSTNHESAKNREDSVNTECSVSADTTQLCSGIDNHEDQPSRNIPPKDSSEECTSQNEASINSEPSSSTSNNVSESSPREPVTEPSSEVTGSGDICLSSEGEKSEEKEVTPPDSNTSESKNPEGEGDLSHVESSSSTQTSENTKENISQDNVSSTVENQETETHCKDEREHCKDKREEETNNVQDQDTKVDSNQDHQSEAENCQDDRLQELRSQVDTSSEQDTEVVPSSADENVSSSHGNEEDMNIDLITENSNSSETLKVSVQVHTTQNEESPMEED